jgi:hypothetical protein
VTEKPSQPKLRLLPTIESDPNELAVTNAIHGALSANFLETVKALEPVGLTHHESFDPVAWWTEIACPVLDGISSQVLLDEPGSSPETIAAAAILRVLSEMLAEFDSEMAEAGEPPSNHPARFKRLVLIVAPPDDQLALTAHALAISLVAGGAAARVVTGPVTADKIEELLKKTKPAVVVIESYPESDSLFAVLELIAPDLPVVRAPAPQGGSVGFAALVERVQQTFTPAAS